MTQRNIIIAVACLILATAGILAARYLAVFETNIFSKPDPIPSGYAIEEIARNLSVPWSIVFTSNDRFLFSERSGSVRVVDKGVLQPAPLLVFEEASSVSEEGLMGMAIAPSYPQTKHVYACLAYQSNGIIKDKVVRFEDRGTEAGNMEVILDDLPAAKYHAGCRLMISDDEKLFITVGDSTEKNLAQDMNSLAGKILRVDLNGKVPSDNPFPKSPIWSLGHRNPQGLSWDSVHNVLWSSEHGPSVFDGPAGGDEINIIEKGKNYGWPKVSHEKHQDGLEDPIIVFTPALAPGSILYYSNDTLPFFKNSLLFGGLVGEGLYRLVLGDDIRAKPKMEKIPEVANGRIREVVEAPDGSIYFSTSNRDGRGKIQDGDDKIYRIIPKF